MSLGLEHRRGLDPRKFVDAHIVQCEGKFPHRTWHAAKRAIQGTKHVSIYRCPHCHAFHVGHAAQRVRVPNIPEDGFED